MKARREKRKTMGSGKPKVRVIKRRYPLELESEAPDAKGARFYPPEDKPVPVKRNVVHSKTKLKNSLTPGTIVILLAGSFKGKRCVFLKQLESGLLLVAGPKAVNGVPLRRVNQAYVIGTSTKISFSGLDLSKFTDEYFKRPVSARGSSGEEEFFDEKPKKFTSEATPEYLEDNKTVDAILSKAIDGKTKFNCHPICSNIKIIHLFQGTRSSESNLSSNAFYILSWLFLCCCSCSSAKRLLANTIYIVEG